MSPLKTRCPRGHAYEGTNLILNPNGGRECRKCRDERSAEWADKNPRRAREMRRAAKKRYYAKNAERLRAEALARYHEKRKTG